MPFVNIKVTGGDMAPSKEQKAEIIKETTEMLVRILGKNPANTVVVIEEVAQDAWGMGGISVEERRKQS